MHDNIKPRMLNKICAHPEIVACMLSACVFGAVSYSFWKELLQSIPHSWQWILYFWVLAVPAATLLVCFIGYLILAFPICAICYRINGAPLRIGDQVVVLSGPYKGTLTTVCEITLGQGGSELAVVDLSLEQKEIFEEWSLFRIKRSEQGCKVNWSELAKNYGLKPRMLHKICAHSTAVALTCMLAATGLDALLIDWLLRKMPQKNLIPEILGALFFVMIIGSLSQVFCRRINGGPIKTGDQVLVLSGQYEGTIAEVSEIILQQGWTVAILDLGVERKEHFNTQSLVKIRKKKQIGKLSGEDDELHS